MMEYLVMVPKAYLVLAYTAPIVFGFFCAYWAQETRRNAWLWFFFGSLLPPVAGIFLLMLNADRHLPSPAGQGENLGALLAVRKDVV